VTIMGTCHFVSRQHAIKYYRSYEFSDDMRQAIPKDVDLKIGEGLIRIGKPTLRKGERLLVIDNGCRYAVESDS